MTHKRWLSAGRILSSSRSRELAIYGREEKTKGHHRMTTGNLFAPFIDFLLVGMLGQYIPLSV